jgi:signal transduction histidine kinase
MRVLQRVPISLRIPLMTAALMVLVGIIASQQVLSNLGDIQDARVREVAQLHVEALAVALGPNVLRKDVWEVYDTLDRAIDRAAMQRMTFAAVADNSGRVLAATDPERAPLDSSISALIPGTQNMEDISVTGNEPHIRLLSNIVYQNRVVGQILMEMNVADLLSERRQAGRLLLLGNMFVTGILALLGYLAISRMLTPITGLMQRMRDFAEAPEPVPESDLPPGDTEMTRLVRSYNTMAGAVEAKAEADRRLAERERFVSLGRLSSSLAHEINNPLGGLLNAADTIRKFADRPDVVRQSAELLTRGLNHLRDVARATLDQNRLDRAGSPLRKEDFDDLRLLIAPEIARQQQSLAWQVDEVCEMLAEFASAPVRQIALNLLLNATEAAGKGGQVGLTVNERAGQLHLGISDSGQGFTKAACERLLGTGPATPGSGVGLRLVRDLVAELQGHIRLNRADGTTTIEIDLPGPECAKSAVC